MIDTAGPMLQERGMRSEGMHIDVFFTPESDADANRLRFAKEIAR